MMKRSTFFLSVSIIIALAIGCLGKTERDSFIDGIPIINEMCLDNANISISFCRFSKDSNRILLTCTPSQTNQGETITYQYHVFDVDSNQVKSLAQYQTTIFSNFAHFDPDLEYIIHLIPDLLDDSPHKPGINFTNPQQILGNPPPQPSFPVRPFKICNLWRDSEIFLNRGHNAEPVDFFDVGFDNITSEIWLRDKEPGLGHRYGCWQLYDNLGRPIQQYPNDLNGFEACNILSGIPISSPDGFKVAFLVGTHFELTPVGREENDYWFVLVCERSTGECVAQIPVDHSRRGFIRSVPYHISQFVMFSNDSRSLFIQDSPWQISLVDIETQQIVQMFNIRKMFPNCFHTIRMKEVTRNGSLIIATIAPSTAKSDIPCDIVWNAQSDDIIQTYDTWEEDDLLAPISPDTRTILSFDRFEPETDEETGLWKETKTTRQVTFIDAKTGEILATQEVPANGCIMPVEISNDWSKMVGYGKGKLIVYDISSIINRP